MNNITTALTLILAIETSDMDCNAVGDKHLPPARRAYGRMGIRKPVLDDFNQWDHKQITWTREDSKNPELDIIMAQRWLIHWCGAKATVKRYLMVWNGGAVGWRSADANAYYWRAMAIIRKRPEHFLKCKQEVERMLKP